MGNKKADVFIAFIIIFARKEVKKSTASTFYFPDANKTTQAQTSHFPFI